MYIALAEPKISQTLKRWGKKNNSRRFLIEFTCAILILTIIVACGPSKEDLDLVDYTPLVREDWPVSTSEEQGLDSRSVAEMYLNAAELETLYSLLVIRNGYLVAEDYFNEGSVDQKDRIQSVTKSFTSALVGIALEQGCLSSVDQKMLDFFPEIADRITDPRKHQITIRNLLEMRSGYPREEDDQALWDGLLSYRCVKPILFRDGIYAPRYWLRIYFLTISSGAPPHVAMK